MAGVPPKRPPVDAFNSFTRSPLSPRGDGTFSNHDWGQRPKSQRRGSAASSVSSIGGTLDISGSSRLGTVTETGQNGMCSTSINIVRFNIYFYVAISTLLQPPIVRTGLLPHATAPASASHKPPSSRDIPPVTLTNIPHVESSFFKPYLSQVGSLFDARSRTETDPPSPQVNKKERKGSKDEELSGYFEQPLSRDPLSPRNSISEPPQFPRRRSSAGRRNHLAVAPLSSIPNVYFDENFHLENPRIFDVVTERSEVIRTPHGEDSKAANGTTNGISMTPRKALATNAILQEKLSWYLDTVEIHLISSISSASKSFFAALGSLKELHSEAADSVAKIQRLRADLAQLDKDMAMGRLEIVRLNQRQQNLHKLASATQQLQNVINGATHCEELVDQGELETSLDRIGILEDYTCGHFRSEPNKDCTWLVPEPLEPPIDLRKLRALEGFDRGMNQLRERIGSAYQYKFMEILLSDLRNHVTAVPANDTLQRWASTSQRSRGIQLNTTSFSSAPLQASKELRQKLAATLVGLKRSKYTLAATAAFRDAVSKEMKAIIRRNLPSASDDDTESVASTSTRSSRAALSQQEKSAILARNLRSLDPRDAEELFTGAYCGVGEALRRLQFQCKLLLDVSSDQALSPIKSPVQSQSFGSLDIPLNDAPHGRSPSPNLHQELSEALDLSSLLGQAVDVAQSQLIKVLKVRSEQATQLSLDEFLRYFTLNKLFADECEALSGRSGAALKGVINNQISDFIGIYTESERQDLAQAMDSDEWGARDLTDADNKTLSYVLDGMTSDPPSFLKLAYIWNKNQINGNGIAGNAVNDINPTSRSATIDEEKFILPPCAVLLLHGISRFETLIACMPGIASEVSSSLVDYLKLFNSKSCQLILGAGATKSAAALKNINTKHLALASQALGFVIALIPYIREFIRRKPGMAGGAAMSEYDKVKRLYQDHQISIHEKLVEIMTLRAASHIKTMSNIDWDADAGREGASHYMEVLTKETISLNRALLKHMPEPTVHAILEPVFGSYSDQWGEAFKRASPKTEAGKAR
jgi:vacuolar protein sorting-associated protein 54